MIWLSALLVFGTAGLVVLNLTEQDGVLYLGFQQLVHARIPWLILGLLWGGVALGVGAWLRKRAWHKVAVLVLELPLVALGSWYFLAGSFLPAHALNVAVGDSFPSYALADQDGAVHRLDAGTPREPALYIFYRGDW